MSKENPATPQCICHLQSNNSSPPVGGHRRGCIYRQNLLQQETQVWLQCVEEWFPHRLSRTYFVPPFHFNRPSYQVTTVAGQIAFVTYTPQRELNTGQQQTTPEQDHPVEEGTNKTRPSRTSLARLSSIVDLKGQRSRGRNSKSKGEGHTSTRFETKPFCVASPGSEMMKTQTVSSLKDLFENTLPSPDTANGKSRPTVNRVKPVSVMYSDVRDDLAVNKVLQSFKTMTDSCKEIMMVFTNFHFCNYLNKLSSEIAEELPQAVNLPKNLRRGDFDLLVIHRTHGILVGEIKAVGDSGQNFCMSESEIEKALRDRIFRSIKQLDKAEEVIKHLTLDICVGLSVRKTIILPNINSQQLKRIVESNVQMQGDLIRVLEAQNASSTDLCLCSDQLSSDQEMRSWWSRRMVDIPSDPIMTDSRYDQLIARFVGPASTIEVHCVVPPRVELRTLGEGVSEAAERLTRLVLTPEQVELLHRQPPLVYLSGPPGTGKTIILILMALEWLRCGCHVHIVSTWQRSLAASFLIQQQLQMTLKAESEVMASTYKKISLHKFDFRKGQRDDQKEEVNSAVNLMSGLVTDNKLYVISDEADSGWGFQEFCRQLTSKVPGLHLWSAAVVHLFRPRILQGEVFKTALRCPPTVVQEVKQVHFINSGAVHQYEMSQAPLPTEGPPVKHLTGHREGKEGHKKGRTLDCQQCGKDVAEFIKKLQVGPYFTPTIHPSIICVPPPLQYRDVFVLSCHDVSPELGFVEGLQMADMPVRVLLTEEDIRAAAQADQYPSCILLAKWEQVSGLERKVVVWLSGSGKWDDAWGRLFAMSRCAGQLVWVEKRTDDEDESDDDFLADYDEGDIDESEDENEQLADRDTFL